MKSIRKFLFPFSIIYGLITQFRNYSYDIGWLQSYSFDLPIIAVGNLSVGGTGKTPQIEYLINLLSDQYKVAVLSRGYKRSTKGFVLADHYATAQSIGDEPFQYFQKFKNITVAVDADRKNGIEKLVAQNPKPEVILLDDAFQHRKVKAGFYIVLTAFDDLFYNDCMLPTGNLREKKSGINRADMIIITKCPSNLSEIAQANIISKIDSKKPIFFTSINYNDEIISCENKLKISDIIAKQKLLLTGIAKPKPFLDYLKNDTDSIMTYPDHHQFTEKEIIEIQKKSENKIIITTEKDYVRLQNSILANQLYYLPIKSNFISKQESFNSIIQNYVEQSTRNG